MHKCVLTSGEIFKWDRGYLDQCKISQDSHVIFTITPANEGGYIVSNLSLIPPNPTNLYHN